MRSHPRPVLLRNRVSPRQLRQVLTRSVGDFRGVVRLGHEVEEHGADSEDEGSDGRPTSPWQNQFLFFFFGFQVRERS